jgi:hypothetical protein
LLAGILIDIDHVFDYYSQRGVTLKIKKIYVWCAETEYNFLFLWLHSLELVILLWLIISFLKLGIFWISFAIGITQHMLLDILFNPVYPYAYFLSYRIIKGPDKKNLLKEF